MADVTVIELAQAVRTSAERLLNQLQEAGLPFTDVNQTVNEEQKRVLLNHIKNSANREKAEAPQRFTVQRTSSSQMVLGGETHGSKKVTVQFKTKRTFVK